MSRMTIILCQIALVLSTPLHIHSQAPFQALLGNSYNETLYYTTHTGDSFIHAGFKSGTNSSSEDGLIVMTDSLGSPLWARSYGGDYADNARIIHVTDEGYSFAGRTESFGAGYRDYYFATIDGQGTLLSYTTYGGPGDDLFEDCSPTADGGYLITGGTYNGTLGSSEILVLKLDKMGHIMWSRVIGGGGFEIAYSIKEDANGDIVILGYSNSFSTSSNLYIVKLDGNGDFVWQKSMGGSGDEYVTAPQALFLDVLGNIYIAGYSNSYGLGALDWYISKLDPNGDLVWSNVFGGNLDDVPRSIQLTSQNQILVTGRSAESQTVNNEPTMLLLDPNGEQVWAKIYRGPDRGYLTSAIEYENGSFLVTGWNANVNAEFTDMLFIGMDPDINSECGGESTVLGMRSASSSIETVYGVSSTSILGISKIPVAQIQTSDVSLDYELLCQDSTSVSLNESQSLPDTYSLFPNTPNPFNPSTRIDFALPKSEQVNLQIFDIKGNEVRTLVREYLPAGNHSIMWNGLNNKGTLCEAGIYTCRMTAGSQVRNQKMTYLK